MNAFLTWLFWILSITGGMDGQSVQPTEGLVPTECNSASDVAPPSGFVAVKGSGISNGI